MAQRTFAPTKRFAKTAGAHDVADQLASSTLAWPAASSAIVDQSLSPPDGPRHVVLPDCRGCRFVNRRPSASPTGPDPHVWDDMIAPACMASMTKTELSQLQCSSGMPDARAGIDRVDGGLARTIEPGFEDVARIACPYARASVMLTLGWLHGSCACVRALLSSLPDDAPYGLYAKAGAMPPTPDQLADRARDEQHQRQRSLAWSALLRARAEERRRPPIGDLFHEFNARDRPAALTPTHPAP